jgi:hypothetical protein
MLRATFVALRRIARAPAPPQHRQAWRARDNAVWYLDRLLDAARDDLVRGRCVAAARALLVFPCYLPHHPVYAWRRLGSPLRLVRPDGARAGGLRVYLAAGRATIR